MRIRLIAAILGLFTLLQATNLYGSEPAGKYFPLKPGLTWTYNVILDKSENRKIVVTNLAAKEMGGITVIPRKWDMGGMVKYFLMAADNMGVYRYGEQQSEDAEPILTKPKVYSLRDPVAIGTTWDINTKMGEDELTVNLTVESVSETVTVPAGTYKDCVKIRHEGGNPKKGIKVESYEWFAPEVGQVKAIATITRVNKDKSKTAEHLTYQLESFKP